MRIERRYTNDTQDTGSAQDAAYAGIAFRLTTSEIRNPDGSVVFKLDNSRCRKAGARSPATCWRRNISARPACRRALKRVEEKTVPDFLWRSVADEEAIAALPEKERTIGEHSAKQVFDRLAGTWTYWGWKGGYFDARSGRARLLRRAAATCWRRRNARPIRRNGSTPACTGPMASTARARAITMSITRPAG